jgi:predicted RNase H-like HicB family nuclease
MPKLNMVYWRAGEYWLGKLLEHPDIMSQGFSLEELGGKYQGSLSTLMVMDEVPENHQIKELVL